MAVTRRISLVGGTKCLNSLMPSTLVALRAQTTASSSSPAFSSTVSFIHAKKPFEELLQELLRTPTLRVDISPVKRPLLEGSVAYDSGKMKVTLASGLCGNSRAAVEEKLRLRAEELMGALQSENQTPSEGVEVMKQIQSQMDGIPQLLNQLDIHLHLQLDLVEHDQQSCKKRFRCTIYARDEWEPKIQWSLLTGCVQHPSEFFRTMLRRAAAEVKASLQKAKKSFYFEGLKEAELLLQEAAGCVSGVPELRFLKPCSLRPSVILSSRSIPLLLKTSLEDESGNTIGCVLPLAGAQYSVIGETLHVAVNHQYCKLDESCAHEVPLVASVSGDGSVDSSDSDLCSSLPSSARAFQHLAALVPPLWFEFSVKTLLVDLHYQPSYGISHSPRTPRICTAVAYAGFGLYENWWTECCQRGGTRKCLPLAYSALGVQSSRSIERYESKLSQLVGWRCAPIIQSSFQAFAVAFAVQDSRRRVFAVGAVFESVEELSAECQFELRGREGSLASSEVGPPVDGMSQIDIKVVDVEDTLKSIGVVSSEFDEANHSVTFTFSSHSKAPLVFRELNEPHGLARMFSFCQRHPLEVRYRTIKVDHSSASTYCRRVQRLLSLSLRGSHVVKPGLRGRLMPIPVPFTTKFLVMSFPSLLQREVYSANLMAALAPFCHLPPDFPTFMWPLQPLSEPCFFNFWSPTKKLLQRLGPSFYCSLVAVRSEGNTSFTLMLHSGIASELSAFDQVQLQCEHANELPIAVLRELDLKVWEATRSSNGKSQLERLQTLLSDRGVPRDISLASPQCWMKILRLLFDSQEFYVKTHGHYRLLLDISPSVKLAELSSCPISGDTPDDVWKQELASQYGRQVLLPYLKNAVELHNRAVRALERIPCPSTINAQKFFAINIRTDTKHNSFHASLSAGSSSFRKDTIQGVAASTPTAALSALLSEIDKTSNETLKAMGQAVYEEITTGTHSDASTAPSSLICSLEMSASQSALSPYLEEAQGRVKQMRNVKSIEHGYHWGDGKLSITGTSSKEAVLLASCECEWDCIPLVLPQLYRTLIGPSAKKDSKVFERAMTKGAVSVLEQQIRSRMIATVGSEKLFQNIRVVQAQGGESTWFAALRLPTGIFKINLIGTSPVDANSAEFNVYCSNSTKKGALRTLLRELHALYVVCDKHTPSLIGGCPSVLITSPPPNKCAVPANLDEKVDVEPTREKPRVFQLPRSQNRTSNASHRANASLPKKASYRPSGSKTNDLTGKHPRASFDSTQAAPTLTAGAGTLGDGLRPRRVSAARSVRASTAARQKPQGAGKEFGSSTPESLLDGLLASADISVFVPTDSRYFLQVKDPKIVQIFSSKRAGEKSLAADLIATYPSQELWFPYHLMQSIVPYAFPSANNEAAASGRPQEQLAALCQRLSPPTSFLTPTMPAKHFCVFFFKRYFGWRTFSAEDVTENQCLLQSTCPRPTFVILAESRLRTSSRWTGRVRLAEFSPSRAPQARDIAVLSASQDHEDKEEAMNSAWEHCMLTIVSSFRFGVKTNIYQYTSLDESVVCGLGV